MNTLTQLSELATAIAVGIAAFQLWREHQQSLTTFEDSFAREYRELAAKIPTQALLGKELSESDQKEKFDEFYHYFDLSNEQVFLRQNRRVSKQTWMFWRDGIHANLSRPAFARAWTEIDECIKSDKTCIKGDFAELRRLIATDFNEDPAKWPKT